MIKYKDGYKHQLAEDYSIQTDIQIEEDVLLTFISLTANGFLTIKRGYAWDGASGPTWDTPSCKRASLVHDAIYQLMREEKVSLQWRFYADRLLKEIGIEDGMWTWRACLWEKMVNRHALKSATHEGRRKIITAP